VRVSTRSFGRKTYDNVYSHCSKNQINRPSQAEKFLVKALFTAFDNSQRFCDVGGRSGLIKTKNKVDHGSSQTCSNLTHLIGSTLTSDVWTRLLMLPEYMSAQDARSASIVP
jgi:hypothetical protein